MVLHYYSNSPEPMEHEMYSTPKITFKKKKASWQRVLTLSITMTLHTGQGLHSICDKDNRVTSEAKSDDAQQVCI